MNKPTEKNLERAREIRAKAFELFASQPRGTVKEICITLFALEFDRMEGEKDKAVKQAELLTNLDTEALHAHLKEGGEIISEASKEIQSLQSQLTELQKEKNNACEHCGSTRIYHGPPDCPMCGAPNCCQTCCKITTLELERNELQKERDELKELHQMQLAGVSTASIQNTETTIKDRITTENPYYTTAYADVCRAIDREMAARKQRDDALERLKELLKSADAEWYVNNGGHDWRDAVLAAESFLAEQKKGETE